MDKQIGKLAVGLGLWAVFLWCSWELFHRSYHIYRDHSLLDLPGVKGMMLSKVLFLVIALMALVFFHRRKRKITL